MLWALLAAFLRNRPPGVQASMFGLCTGLFVAAATVGVGGIAHVGVSTLLVLVVAVLAGGVFHVASAAQRRPGSSAARIDAACAAVWLVLLLTALRALLGAGGYRVAVFAIVPIVLLAPPALAGIRSLTGRRAEPGAPPPRRRVRRSRTSEAR